jgi:AcrR family transcriptional regulator
MVQSPGQARALDQARRPRVTKPADERRREILEAAARLFGDRSFESTTVQAIATAAGVAAGTVYLYFPSKDAVLDALRDDFEAGLLDRFAEISEEVLAEEARRGEDFSYEEVVARLVDGIVGYSLERRALAELITRHLGRRGTTSEDAILASGLTETLTRVIAESVRLGYIHTSDPQMSAYLLNLAAVGAVGNAITSGDDAMLARVVSATKELFVKTLAPRSAKR